MGVAAGEAEIVAADRSFRDETISRDHKWIAVNFAIFAAKIF